LILLGKVSATAAQEESGPFQHLVMPGDTWTALAWRYGIHEEYLRSSNPHPNKQWQPAIGKFVSIPNDGDVLTSQTGMLHGSNSDSLLEIAVQQKQNLWSLAVLNGLEHIWQPLLMRPIFAPDETSMPKQFPPGFHSLELMSLPVYPGQGQALRAVLNGTVSARAAFADQAFEVFSDSDSLTGLFATGAFFPPGDHLLTIEVEGSPLWSQPVQVVPGEWNFEDITLTGSAAAIDAESIRLERERLSAIWNQSSSTPLWETNFNQPIEQFLQISSNYGARRSYNGGPYSSYHEGVDFSAYGGTPVTAPASGIVVLAENLYVRGGAVIIDHGLGVYTGLYHMSELLVETGQTVNRGQIVGRVGSTGLSTGNHLHWDLLVNGIWVDAAAWHQSDIACWIVEVWERNCRDE
jgi:murein DD-endopeptidase MepM/ murein hydrolase activator NlpD